MIDNLREILFHGSNFQWKCLNLMPKEDTIKIDGTVEELLPNMTFQSGPRKRNARDRPSLWKNADEKYPRPCRGHRHS